jgi:hypothetical protein
MPPRPCGLINSADKCLIHGEKSFTLTLLLAHTMLCLQTSSTLGATALSMRLQRLVCVCEGGGSVPSTRHHISGSCSLKASQSQTRTYV